MARPLLWAVAPVTSREAENFAIRNTNKLVIIFALVIIIRTVSIQKWYILPVTYNALFLGLPECTTLVTNPFVVFPFTGPVVPLLKFLPLSFGNYFVT